MARLFNYKEIRRIRREKDITQKELSQKIDMTHTAYSKRERGEQSFSVDELAKILDILEIPEQNILNFFIENVDE